MVLNDGFSREEIELAKDLIQGDLRSVLNRNNSGRIYDLARYILGLSIIRESYGELEVMVPTTVRIMKDLSAGIGFDDTVVVIKTVVEKKNYWEL